MLQRIVLRISFMHRIDHFESQEKKKQEKANETEMLFHVCALRNALCILYILNLRDK